MPDLPNQDVFTTIARALNPYHADLVIAGAWCHRLLHFHPLAIAPPFAPLMSEDADVATPEALPPRSPDLGELLKGAGFTASLSGSGAVPVSKYFPPDDELGLYVEFIAPLRGSGLTRAGASRDTLSVAGITASRLRHVELLLLDPWTYRLGAEDGFPVVPGEELMVRVANPVSYLAQKVLTLNRRQQREKRSKDVLYIFDTLSMFGAAFSNLRDSAAIVLAELPARTRSTFHRLRDELFRDEALIAEAAAIADATGRASPPSKSTIASVCTLGLQAVFA